MNIRHVAIWIGFLLCIGIMQFQISKLTKNSTHHYGIIDFEFAKQDQVPTILAEWDNGQVLNYARINTVIDFVFIVFYILLVIMLSYRRMELERNYLLNNLLRLNFLLIIVAGLLDVTEDIFLLRNIHAFHAGGSYVSTYWIASTKFVLAGWTVFVWLISLIKSVFSRQGAATAHR